VLGFLAFRCQHRLQVRLADHLAQDAFHTSFTLASGFCILEQLFERVLDVFRLFHGMKSRSLRLPCSHPYGRPRDLARFVSISRQCIVKSAAKRGAQTGLRCGVRKVLSCCGPRLHVEVSHITTRMQPGHGLSISSPRSRNSGAASGNSISGSRSNAPPSPEARAVCTMACTLSFDRPKLESA
jgi:hypothetical protein